MSWVSDWELVPGNSAGKFTGGGNKLVIHTTEGFSVDGAISAYRKNNSWPHATICFENKRKVRHLSLDVAARSLANNTADGFQTNRANCVQVEIVGKAGEASGWPKEKLDWIAECFQEIREVYDFPLIHPEFKLGATRFNDKEFVGFEGIVGHQHVPDNDHWDPGDLDVEYIVSRMKGYVEQKQEGRIVVKTLDFEANLSCDSSGNGYVDVFHRQGANPSSVSVTANGGISKGTYPSYSPQFWVARMDGQYVRITSVKNQANARFDIQVSMNFV